LSNTPDKGSDPKGFAGFDLLISDVEQDIADAMRAAPQSSSSQTDPLLRTEAPRQPAPPNETTSQSMRQSAGPKPTEGSHKGWWAIGIIAFVFWVVGNQGNKNLAPSPTSDPPSTPSQTPTAPVQGLTPDGSWNEEEPPAGVGRTLNYAQLRYCVAEDFRLKAMEGKINQYSHVEVDGFNIYVSNYNNRCGNFQYRSGSLESVQRDAVSFRARFENEGRRRVLYWRPKRRPVDPQYPAPPAVSSVAPIRSLATSLAGMQSQEGIVSAPIKNSQVSLNDDERASLESACSNDKYLNGPAAYNSCLARQLKALEGAPRDLDLTGLSAAERASAESACSNDKYLNGPAAYNKCITRQLASLSSAPRDTDLSWLNEDERVSLDSACSNDKYLNGPAALDACITRHVAALRKSPRNSDLSALGSAARSAVEMACSNDKYINGPAAYNRCVLQQVASVGR
jgi:hypothetical protein